jgi:pSer/pThr/pTyr-binding forkhead associated (FHA) protein
MPARLTILFSTRPARVVLLPDGREAVVGRDPGCDVVLDDGRVSRRHARFAPDPSGPSDWSLADLGSKNGTLADGLPVSGALRERSWISFGGLLARFEAGGGERPEDERRRRLTTSLDVQRRRLSPDSGLRELLPQVVASLLELANAERGFLLLATAEGELDVVARSGISWEELSGEEFGGSAGVVRRVLASDAPVVSADTRADAELGARASVVAAGIRALLCVPVRALDRSIGVLYADSRRPGAAFTELDLEIVEALAAQAGLAIATARLHDELAELSRHITEVPDAARAERWPGPPTPLEPRRGAGS